MKTITSDYLFFEDNACHTNNNQFYCKATILVDTEYYEVLKNTVDDAIKNKELVFIYFIDDLPKIVFQTKLHNDDYFKSETSTVYEQGALSNEEFNLKKFIASVSTYSMNERTITYAGLKAIWSDIKDFLAWEFDLESQKDTKVFFIWTEKNSVCIES